MCDAIHNEIMYWSAWLRMLPNHWSINYETWILDCHWLNSVTSYLYLTAIGWNLWRHISAWLPLVEFYDVISLLDWYWMQAGRVVGHCSAWLRMLPSHWSINYEIMDPLLSLVEFCDVILLPSVVEPEPDFLAGAGADEKAPAPGCCCLA